VIEEFAKLIASDLKYYSGAVFYSVRNTFQGKKDLYILGLNPGGSALLLKEEIVSVNTVNTLNRKNYTLSEYLDESWKGHNLGTHGLQPRILHLLKE